MIGADLILAALAEAMHTPDPAPVTAAGVSGEWRVQRPNRSSSVIRAAATVPARWRSFAVCVLHRESGATLDRPQSGAGARNSHSSASGRWQMLDASGWRVGGAHMVRTRLIRFGATRIQARAVYRYLAATPIYRWHGTWQDIAAFESLEAGGWRAWSGARCNGLAAR